MPNATTETRLPQMHVYDPGRTGKDGKPYRKWRVRVQMKDHYLGDWGPTGSPEHAAAVERYNLLMAEFLRHGSVDRISKRASSPTIDTLVAMYTLHLREQDVLAGDALRRGERNARSILDVFNRGFGSEPIVGFNLEKLTRWQRRLATMPVRREAAKTEGGWTRPASSARWSRNYINNKAIRTVIALFKFGRGKGMVPREVLADVQDINPLSANRTTAPDREARRDVSDAVVAKTLPLLNPYIADVVQLIRIVGARPSEICSLTPAMIDRSLGDVWFANLDKHKNAHRGKLRVLTFDSSAQKILDRHTDSMRPMAPIFSAGKFNESVE